MRHATLHFKTFLWLLLVVSIAFAWLLLPFYGAVFWGTVLSIIFSPIQRWLVGKFGNRPTLAALATLLLVLVIVIIPLLMIAGGLVQEGALIYQQIKTGDLNFGLYFQQAVDALPTSIHSLLTRFDLTDIRSLQTKLSAGAMQGSQFLATKAFSIGQDTFQFVISFGIMLYLLFFLLRDGPYLARRIRNTIPLSEDHKLHLLQKFTTVIRATVKGNIVVAIAQGALGGLIFWILGIQGALLWGTMMAFLSLLPAIGAALIWGPVAVYFLLTGATGKGVVLILFCVLVIGVVDNVLRPILVGKDTQMPDYVVLIATLGGMSLFGINGFVIGPVIAALFMASWDLFGSTREPSRD
jgi:predicted PurR-regulated permease PerM